MQELPAGRTAGGRAPGVLSVADVLAGVALLSRATGPEIATLAAASGLHLVARGQLLLLEGERSDCLYALAAGRLKVLLSSARGDELVLSLLGPGDALGEISVLDGLAHSATVQATVDSVVVAVPGEALRTVLAVSPALALAWATALAGHVRRLTDSEADLVFLDLPRRLAKLLLASGGGTVDLVGSQSELAARLGVARQSLNRALSALQSRGWLSVDGSVVVLRDRAALRHFVDS